MEEKKDTEEKQKEQNEEEKKPIDNERQKAFELIYSKIKIIKEKHKRKKKSLKIKKIQNKFLNFLYIITI